MSKMEDDAHSANRLRGHARIIEICPGELDPSGFDTRANVVQRAAAEVVDDPHSCSMFEESIDQVRTDQVGAACYERLANTPVHL
jgi:hypothetical protein